MVLAKVERTQSLSVNLPPQPGGCQDLKQGTITHSNIKGAHEGALPKELIGLEVKSNVPHQQVIGL